MTPSFPHRMVAVIARIVLAIVEDLPAAVADVACLVAAVVSLWLLHRLIKSCCGVDRSARPA